ncbi:MAG: transglycosylase domain-containing protein [Gemmatimonadales bacterium]
MIEWQRGIDWLTNREQRWRRIGLLASGVGGVFLIVLAAWVGTCGFHGCPSAAQIQAFRPSEGSRVVDRSGKPIGRLTHVRRVNVSLDEVPKSVRAAFIATEDRRFYYHGGVDWRSAARALVTNLSHAGIREGFSTITMQVVRNAFLPHLSRERTLRRKLIELELARRLERSLSKQQILQMYLNVIYLGNGTYGVEAASRDLFGKGVSRISVAEAATLAGLAKGPSLYTPRRHPERALARRNLVLSLMARERYITPELARRARNQPLHLAKAEWRPPQDRSYALDPVRAVVDSVLGDDAATAGDLIVHSTLDAEAQQAAESAIRIQAAAIERQTPGSRKSTAELEGAVVALDPRTGEIRTLVGGRRSVRRGFNRALEAHRQPGSAFKPFVYAAALNQGYSPATILDDSPVAIENAGRIWRPENFGGEYGGQLTLRRALMRSANAATVRLSQAVGEGRVAALAQRAGIRSRMDAVPSLALGALEVTPLELVAAYAPFANGGMKVQPYLVSRIEAADGSLLWQARPAKPERVLGRAEAFQITSMLQSVVDGGTGRVVRNMGVKGLIAGKTGTTNNGADVWFIGYSPTLVAGFWFGYDSPRPIASNASAGRLAAPAWATFYLNGWHERTPSDAWHPPADLVGRKIDAYNGKLSNEWCPVVQHEWFKSGTEPTLVCDRHDAPFLDQLEEFGRRLGKVLGRILEQL